MRSSIFSENVGKVERQLTALKSKVSSTITLLERMLHAPDEVEVQEWEVQDNTIFVTFVSPAEIENVSLTEEQAIKDTLIRLFPKATISGTTIKIEFSELF